MTKEKETKRFEGQTQKPVIFSPKKEKSEKDYITEIKKRLGEDYRQGGGSFITYGGILVPRDLYDEVVLGKINKEVL